MTIFSHLPDRIFRHLQLIPTGHDRDLGQSSAPHQPSALTPLSSVPPHAAALLPDTQEYPYQTFFNIYKPVTKYRKSAPPPPDFRIVVIKCVGRYLELATVSLPFRNLQRRHDPTPRHV